MIAEQGVKLVRLAKDILDMEGVSPGEPIWAVPNAGRRNYVVEKGNRRATALLLMETPALADGTSLQRQFKTLAKRFAEAPIREIDALVFETAEELQPWKRRRHMSPKSGVGLADWKPAAKGRANRAHGLEPPRFLAVLEYLADDSDEWEAIEAALDKSGQPLIGS